LPSNVFVIESAPHEWLFPQVAAVIHHGGAGTVAAALRAGVPQMIFPFFGDQFFWAQRVLALGVGLVNFHSKSVTSAKVKEAMITLILDVKIRMQSEQLGDIIRSENGVERAVKVFHQLVNRYSSKL